MSILEFLGEGEGGQSKLSIYFNHLKPFYIHLKSNTLTRKKDNNDSNR